VRVQALVQLHPRLVIERRRRYRHKMHHVDHVPYGRREFGPIAVVIVGFCRVLAFGLRSIDTCPWPRARSHDTTHTTHTIDSPSSVRSRSPRLEW
jgi:hypothetical protein